MKGVFSRRTVPRDDAVPPNGHGLKLHQPALTESTHSQARRQNATTDRLERAGWCLILQRLVGGRIGWRQPTRRPR